MEENKYYIPEIGDIRVGFECETDVGEENIWVKTEITEFPFLNNEMYEFYPILQRNKLIRVPYLTKGDIESESWKPRGNYWTKNNIFIDGEGDYEGYEYRLFYNFQTHSLYIEKLHVREDTGESYYDLYEGNQNHILKSATCRCINDFRLIMKLLNIK